MKLWHLYADYIVEPVNTLRSNAKDVGIRKVSRSGQPSLSLRFVHYTTVALTGNNWSIADCVMNFPVRRLQGYVTLL